MQLSIQSTIENTLKKILQDATETGEIDVDYLRMVVLSPDITFQKLQVCISTNWDSYFYKTDHVIIGEINIAQWLDIADDALENQHAIESTYIDRAKELNKQYSLIPPAINFDHLQSVNETYAAYLVCLREDLLTQIEAGISNVATTFSQDDFKHIVGFFTHALRFDLENNVLLHAFNNPLGIAPFYKVEIALPNNIRSNHYLHFTENGFQLYCTKGTYLEKTDSETEVYTYDVSDIAYMYEQGEEIHFRLQDEFENWTLVSRGANAKAGDKSETEFLIACKDFFNKFPEKVFESTHIPNPLIDKDAFNQWFDFVEKYNIPVRYKNLEKIFQFGEDAYTYLLNKIPKNTPLLESAQQFLARKLFYTNRFQDSITIFKGLKNPSDENKIEYLCALLCLNEKEKYETFALTLDSKSNLKMRDLLRIVWMLREPMTVDALNSIKEQLTPLVSTYKNNISFRLLSVVLTKVYVLLNESDAALLQLQSTPTHETYERVVLLNELKDVDYINQAYEQQKLRADKNAAFSAQIENYSLKTADTKKTPIEKTAYAYSYYLKDRIPLEDYNWMHPLDAETFFAVIGKNELRLILAKITEEKTVEIIHQIELPKTHIADSGIYADGIIYIADKEQGIITYTVSDNTFEQGPTIYNNKKNKANYHCLTIANGYLYAGNDGVLEIYNIHADEPNLFSDSIHIRGYKLFVKDNLLVVCANQGLLVFVDITDKTHPVFITSIQEEYTPNNMHVAFIDNFIISRSVYDIKDPANPIWIRNVNEELAPIYYFAPKPEVPLISTGGEFLFTTLRIENGQSIYTNWLESLNKDNWFYEIAIYNLATAYFDNSVITYSKHQILVWEKGLSPIPEKIDVHTEVETMVHNCFNFIAEEYPAFCIGKVVLQHRPLFQDIDISFHESSSPALLSENSEEQILPIISSSLLLPTYCEEVLEKECNPVKTKFVYDAAVIMEQLMHSRFKQLSARHVLIVTDNKNSYLHDTSKTWAPFRIGIRSEIKEGKEESVEEILLSRNESRIKQLSAEISEHTILLEQLLTILNKRKSIPKADTELNNEGIGSEESSTSMETFHELIDETDENIDPDDIEENDGEGKYEDNDDNTDWYCSPKYIIDPYYYPKIEREKETEETSIIPSGFYANTMKTTELQTNAFEILCSLSDRALVRNILFNGMQFGCMHYDLTDLPVPHTFNKELIYNFVRNLHGIWDEFGNDTDIRFFLMSNIYQFDSCQLQIAYKIGHLSHPLLAEYIQHVLNNGVNYYSYKGEATGIDLSIFPAEALKPFESLLLEKAETFENTTDILLQIDAEQQLVYIYALLEVLGHERKHAIVTKKITQAVKQQEEFGLLCYDDEAYEDENMLLTKIYRKSKVNRLLHNYEQNNGPLWPLEEAPECFHESWEQTTEALFKEGSNRYGDSFKTTYIARLAANIPLDESYANDRTFAYKFVEYTYWHIAKKPELASLAEPLVLTMLANKEAFPATLNITALKDKNKYTLLQAAWNDLKNKDWDLAEQKAEAVLIMDPTMGQVYFLKARLLWLREGIPAYLAQENYFIEKTGHDIAAIARLYNLSGCAMDIEKRYEEALAYFKKAALAVPTDSIYTANIAESYYKMNKAKEALKHAKTARANGNESAILKEIIENKGVLSITL